MGDTKLQLAGLVIVTLVVLGGVVYYTYTTSAQLEQKNASLESRLAKLQTNMSLLQSELAQFRAQRLGGPLILLRTWGTALASYREGFEGTTYLRLTETGGSSGVEAALASRSFNASIAGNSVEWRAVANSVAASKNHTFWPMVLENSPGGTNAIEFEDAGGVQEVAVVSNGVRVAAPVKWTATVVHTFKIVIVIPGAQVNFYIDGALVKSMTTAIPKVDFLLEAAEVRGSSSTAAGIATLDVYGGLLSG